MKRRNYNRNLGKVKQIFLLAVLVLFITLLRGRPAGSGPVFDYNRPKGPAQNFLSFFLTTGRHTSAGLHGFIFPPDRADGSKLKIAETHQPENNPPQKAADKKIDGSTPLTTSWLDELLDKIWAVESSRQLNPPDGDGGAAIGPLQIHADVLIDVNGKYGTNYTCADLRNIETAKTIARLYISMWMERHKAEIACRIFSGGPRGWNTASTDRYWQKIKNQNAKSKNEE